ncbi:MAG: primosomal protein N' [Candidatus Moranbacteria bacterium]|nr:primosomal protein N' [Candidatus Moranbacteria bacterium]
MHYYQVIPLIRIHVAGKPCFTYKSKEELARGDLVFIDFKNKKIKGVIYTKAGKPPFPTKEVLELIQKEALPGKQLKLAEKMSDYFFAPLGVVLKFFFPNFTKKKIKFGNKQKPELHKGDKVVLTGKQKEAVEKINKEDYKEHLLFGPASSGKTEVLMASLEEKLKTGKQGLIILPEIFLSHQEIERYKKRFNQYNAVHLHSEMNPSEKTSIWRGIKSGQINILISTKIGVFYPFKNLGFIALEEEQDASHKQWDQVPHYHAGWAASELVKLYGADLVYCSATPSMETFHKASSEKIQLLELPRLQKKGIKTEKPNIEIVDLRKEFNKFENKKKGFTFSKRIIEAFNKSLERKKTSILMVPNRGKSRAVICSDCRTRLKCPNCQAGLISAADSYRCLHCSYKLSSLARCPSCKSFRLISAGFGTESVARELNDLFPQARVATVDRDALQKKGAGSKIYESLSRGKLDFLVGTQAVAKGFDIKQVDMAGVINADNWAGAVDFRFDERWLGGLFQLAGRINRPRLENSKNPPDGNVIIQTYNPENKLLKHLLEWEWKPFALEELEKRKVLSYPPFREIYKLSYSNGKKEKVEKEARMVYNKLKEIASRQSSLDVSEPYDGTMPFLRQRKIKNILIKSKRPIPKKSEAGKYLSKISDSWRIDPNPDKIF